MSARAKKAPRRRVGHARQRKAAAPETALQSESPLAQVETAPPGRRLAPDNKYPSLSADGELEGDATSTLPKELAAEIARIRKFRRPLGHLSQKLFLDIRPGYHRHWFNDEAGRVQEAEANGWSFVVGKDGKPLQRWVGSGRSKTGLFAYAMEIPEVFWQEDMAERHKVATARINAVKANPFRAQQGQTKAEDKNKFYTPDEVVIETPERFAAS